MRESSIEELRGFEVVEGDPDVRGWAVVGRDGHRIGDVRDLLADSEDPTVRYLDVRLDPRPDEEAPGAGTTMLEIPTRTIGESLVRDSLLDIESRMTSGESPGQPADRSGRRVLLRAESAHLETGRRQVRIDSLA